MMASPPVISVGENIPLTKAGATTGQAPAPRARSTSPVKGRVGGLGLCTAENGCGPGHGQVTFGVPTAPA